MGMMNFFQIEKYADMEWFQIISLTQLQIWVCSQNKSKHFDCTPCQSNKVSQSFSVQLMTKSTNMSCDDAFPHCDIYIVTCMVFICSYFVYLVSD